MSSNTISDQLSSVRFFTDADPYHYTVDNRPLQDLDDNTRLLARLMDSINQSANVSYLAITNVIQGAVAGNDWIRTSGLSHLNSTPSTLSISPGALIQKATTDNVSSTTIYVNTNTFSHSFTLPPPGQILPFIVIYQLQGLQYSTDSRITADNILLQQSQIQPGLLALRVIPGSPMVGAPTYPTVPSGWTLLYKGYGDVNESIPVITEQAYNRFWFDDTSVVNTISVPALATGATYTVNVPKSDASTGDIARATTSTRLAGIFMSCYCNNGSVDVQFTNLGSAYSGASNITLYTRIYKQ